MAGDGVVKKLTCQEVLDQLWEYLDDEARAEMCAEIEGHLSGCCHCRVEVDSLRKTVLLYRAGDESKTPIQLSERLRSALDVAYRETSSGD